MLSWQPMQSLRSLGTTTMPLRWLPEFSRTTRLFGVFWPMSEIPLLLMIRPLVASAVS